MQDVVVGAVAFSALYFAYKIISISVAFYKKSQLPAIFVFFLGVGIFSSALSLSQKYFLN